MYSGLLSFLEAGGFFVYPIIFLSVLTVWFGLERMLALKSKNTLEKQDDVIRLAADGKLEGAQALCSTVKSPFTRIAAVIFQAYDKERLQHSSSELRSILKVHAEEQGKQEVASLEDNLLPISLTASTAPMMGLMGTVWGMILTFEAINEVGMGSISGLAGGISQALITTLLGLSVGIPALWLYRWLIKRVDEQTLELESAILQLVDILVDKSNSTQQEEL